MENMRLQKYIAMCGVASRRKAEELILEGKVKVNGRVVTQMGKKVNEKDLVHVNGKLIRIKDEKIYIMLNKPEGCVSTVKDQYERKTVLDYVNIKEKRLFPVGRLDYNTSGLLILTNDGDFANKITHPRNKIKKTYLAKVTGVPDEIVQKRFNDGIELDGKKTMPAEIKIIREMENKSLVEITIFEGRYRQVRRMFEEVDHPVIRLKRISIGNLEIGTLKRGHYRQLEEKEIIRLLKLVEGTNKNGDNSKKV